MKTRSSETFRPFSLINEQPDLLVLTNLAGEIVFVNQVARHFWETKSKKLRGKSIWELLTAVHLSRAVLNRLAHNMAFGDQLRVTMTAQRPSEKRKTNIDVRITPFAAEHEPLLLFSGRPEPAGKAAADQEFASNNSGDTPSQPNLQEVFDNLQDFFLRIDHRGAILLHSPNLATALEIEAGKELRNFSLRRFIDEETWNQLLEVMESPTGSCHDLPLLMRSRSGKQLLLSFSGTRWRHQDGSVEGLEGTLRDVTEQKIWQQKLQDSDTRYRSLFEQANDAVIVLNGETVIDLNRQAEVLLQSSREFLLGKTLADLSPHLQAGHHSSAVMIESILEHASSGQSQVFEWQARRPDGTPVEVEISLRRIDLAEGPRFLAMLRDISEKRAIEKALRQSERLFNTITNHTGDGIAITDIDGRIIFVNAQLREMFDQIDSDLIGLSVANLVATQHQQQVLPAIAQSFATGENLRLEFWATNPANKPLRLEVNATPTEHDGMPAMIAFLRDVTDRYQSTRELRQHRERLEELVAEKTADISKARDEAEEANRAKSRFLANISHELRTPLHSVLSFAEFGANKAQQHNQPQFENYFDRIRDSGRRLLLLLNELIDLSLLEAGKTAVNKGRYDFLSLVEKVCDDMQLDIGDRAVLINPGQSVGQIMVECDFDLICNVISHLLGNALKFSADDLPIKLFFSQDERQTLFRIADQGVGLVEEEIPTLFAPFAEGERTRTNAGGTGLGLAICREIISAHGGQISGVNNAEGGATFYFTLPNIQQPTDH